MTECIDCRSEGVTTRRKPATDRRGNPVPGKRCVTHHRAKRRQTRDAAWERRLMSTYGITAEEYWRILDAQGGRCYICQRATGAVKRLAVDHDHETGLVRGILCSHDNRDVLGQARDEVEFFERCIDYLRNPPAVRVLGRRYVP